jgi:hypothetical protein
VYLPSGPRSLTPDYDRVDPFSLLQKLLPPTVTLVKVNYSLGKPNDATKPPAEAAVFPTPVHEATAALDHLTSSLSPFNRDEDEPPKICLWGSHIGGALATMLALTEPNSIHALAVLEPMVDWVGLDEIVEQMQVSESSHLTAAQRQAKRQARRQAQRSRSASRLGADDQSVIAAAQELTMLRSKLFKTPSAYFDPFASPMLFLRAPGRDTPLATTVGDQLVSEMGVDASSRRYVDSDPDSFGPYDDEWQDSRSSSALTSSGSSTSAETASSDITTDADLQFNSALPPRRRKVLRRWPAVGIPEAAALPQVKIFVQAESASPQPDADNKAPDLARGHAALMRAQGKELTELMRRACFIGREKSYGEERVEFQLCDPSQAAAMHQSAIEWVAQSWANS